MFNYDKTMSEDIEAITKAVGELYDDSQAERWTEASTKARNIKSLILSFESKWDEREQQFRPAEL